MAEYQLPVNKVIKIDRDLSELQSCDLVQAWGLLKPYIEKQVGKNWFACVPSMTDAASFDITSVFVKVNQGGGMGRRYRQYQPLGKIENLLLKENSYEVWHDISERIPDTSRSVHPSPIEVILNDEEHKIHVSAVFDTVVTRTCPKEFSPIGRVMLDISLAKELVPAEKIYFINEVVQADHIEIRIHVKGADKVFIRDKAQPIAFHYSKYMLSKKKMISQEQMIPKISSSRTHWIDLEVQYHASDDVNVASSSLANNDSGLALGVPADEEISVDDDADSIVPVQELTETFPTQTEISTITAN